LFIITFFSGVLIDSLSVCLGNNPKNFGTVTYLHQFGDDVLEDVGVALHQGQTGLALLLAHSGGHDAQTRVGRGGEVGAGRDLGVLQEVGAVLQIHQLALQLVAADIDEAHLLGDVLSQNAEGLDDN